MMWSTNVFVGKIFLFAVLALAAGDKSHADAIDPPWNPPLDDGLNFTIPGIDNVPDLQGDVNDPQLTVFFAGNQYMVVRDLIAAFRAAHPQYQRIFVETLPPGILVQQIERGALIVGNLRIVLKPDVYAAGRNRVQELQREKQWFSGTLDYARNRLAIMTSPGNPRQLASLSDLAQPGLALCMPNPKWEGIARNTIIPLLQQLGGEALVRSVYEDKVRDGSTFLTRIHHRQTPIRVMEGKCEAGVVWYTEAYFHATLKQHPVGMVTLPDAQNRYAIYTAGVMRDAPHPAAADDFMRFLGSDAGQAIYRRYGFLPAQ